MTEEQKQYLINISQYFLIIIGSVLFIGLFDNIGFRFAFELVGFACIILYGNKIASDMSYKKKWRDHKN